MKLTEAELSYLAGQRLGRLATVDAHGAPQNSPVGFNVNTELGTIDIRGLRMSRSRKQVPQHPHESRRRVRRGRHSLDDAVARALRGDPRNRRSARSTTITRRIRCGPHPDHAHPRDQLRALGLPARSPAMGQLPYGRKMTQHPPLDDQQRRVLSALLAMQRQSWEQGVASHALLDLGLHDLAELIARDAVTRQTDAGKLAEIEDHSVVNSGSAGEVVRWAAERSGDPRLVRAYERQLDWILSRAPRADDGTLFHLDASSEMWIDTVYMVVPLLVLDGHVDAASVQLSGHRRRLFDEATGLYGWRWDEDTERASHAQHWGTGSGWVVAAIARALRILDGADIRFSEEWAAHARIVIDACLAHRASDGLFFNIVDDDSTFSEGNLAQMLAYGILSGVADGWLPSSYEAVGRSLVSSARGLVDEIGFVQSVCGAPNFDRQGTSAEAQAFFLLATAAERRLDSR